MKAEIFLVSKTMVVIFERRSENDLICRFHGKVGTVETSLRHLEPSEISLANPTLEKL